MINVLVDRSVKNTTWLLNTHSPNSISIDQGWALFLFRGPHTFLRTGGGPTARSIVLQKIFYLFFSSFFKFFYSLFLNLNHFFSRSASKIYWGCIPLVFQTKLLLVSE